MIENFEYYLEQNLAKKSTPNKSEAEALFRKAQERLAYIKKQEINDETAPFIFEDIYESAREAIQSLMSLKGFKPYSHVVLVAFLRKYYTFPNSDLNTFDRYRIIRNKAIYGAANVTKGECEEALHFLENFLPKIEKELGINKK